MTSTIKLQLEYFGCFDQPRFETSGAACFDLSANIKSPTVLSGLQRVNMPTGLKAAIPDGYELQIRPRSGLASKHGISIVNSPGTIDSDYTGEILVIIVNLSGEEYTIQPGQRIAQAQLAKLTPTQLEFVPKISKKTQRGDKGLGSTDA